MSRGSWFKCIKCREGREKPQRRGQSTPMGGGELTTQLVCINYSPISPSFGIKTSMICTYYNNVLFSWSSPHSNQNPLFFSIQNSVFISSKFIFQRHFTILQWSQSHENNFDISVRVILLLSRETDICLVLMVVSRFSTWIQLIISGLLIAMGKPIRNACFRTVKHDWTSIIC